MHKRISPHGDEDHINGSFSLNKDTYTNLEKKLISILNKKKIKYTSNISDINKKVYLLNNKEFDNENDNSIIIYYKYKKYSFLFMSDASSNTEEYLLNEYNLSNISFLKVGHHGSNTSTSINFINSINPKVSLISVGKYNYYGHPNKEVLDNLSNSKIYRTDLTGSIRIRINNNVKIIKCLYVLLKMAKLFR